MKRGVGRETAGAAHTPAVSPADLPSYDYQPIESCIDYLERGAPRTDVHVAVLLGLLAAVACIAMVLA